MRDNLDRLMDEIAIRNGQTPRPGATYGPPPLDHPGSADRLDALMAQLNDPAFRASRMQQPQQPAPQPQAPSRAAGPQPQAESALGSAITGIADTATSGFLDEASGLLETLGVTAGTDAQSVWSSGKSFSDTLAANIAYERGLQKADAEAHPYAFHGGQLGGAFLLPVGTGAKGALQVARMGALQGAAYGAGSAEGGLGDRLAGAGEGAVLGAATASVLHPLLNGAAGLVKKLVGKAAPAAEDAAAQAGAAEGEGLTGTVTDDRPNVVTSRTAVTEGTGPADPTPPNPADATPGTPEAPATAWTLPDAEGNRAPVAGAEHLGPTPEGDTPIPLHAGEGEGEPVGSISRAGLEDLQAQVQHFREQVAKTNGRAVDVTPASPEHPTIGAFRLGNLGDGPETMSLLGALVRQLPGVAPKSDAEMWAAANQAAKDIGVNDPEALRALASQMAGPEGNIEGAIALLRTVQRQAADTVDAFHGAGVDWATASEDMVREVGQAIYNVQTINQLVQSAKVGVGRALRVFSLPNSEAYFQAMARGESLATKEGLTPERSIPPLPSTREELANFFELWGMTKGNPELQSDLLQGTLTVPTAGHYLASSAANLFTASILSAPKTAMLNLVGPAFINTLRALEKMSGAAVLSLDPTLSAAERADYAAVAKLTPVALFKTFGDIRDVFQYGVQAFKENHSVLGGGGTVRDANISFGPYNANLLNAAGVDPNWAYSLGNALNLFPKAFARVNAGLDEMAKRFTYLNETRLRAMVEASGQGLEGDAFHAAVRKAMLGAVDEAGAATDQGILDAAERTTLTGQVGSEGNAARRFGQFIQSLRHDYPLTRFILPVFNVPANALGETLKRVPGLDLLPSMGSHVADLSGENGAVAQAEAHGRTLLGASFLTAGYLMNQAGILTGSGPQKPADRAVWLQTHQPYSIRIGDEWVSYRKLDILGGLLSIPATLSDWSVYHKLDQAEQGHTSLAAIATLATWFKDQASMRTATQLLTLGDLPWDNPDRAVEGILGQIAAGSVPASGFLRTVGVDATDPYQRMKRSWEDYVKSVLPGFSRELEPMRNVLGEPINRPNDTFAEALFPVTLAPVATWKDEPVLNELSRLYQKTGYAAGADPASALFGFKDTRDVKLEAGGPFKGESLYTALMQARAMYRLDGMTLREALADLFRSPEYREAVDADAGQSVTSRGDQSRAWMVSSVFNRYGKAIKADVADASPTALAYMTAAAAKHRDDAYLKTIPLEDLVRNPNLYAAHGIDPQEYSDQITDGAAGQLFGALQGGEARR